MGYYPPTIHLLLFLYLIFFFYLMVKEVTISKITCFFNFVLMIKDVEKMLEKKL